MFDWSIIDGQSITEKLSVSLKLNNEELLNSHLSHGHVMSAMTNQYTTQVQQSISLKLYEGANSCGYAYALKDNKITFYEVEVSKSIDDKLLMETSLSNYDFIITNGKLITYLYDSMYFTPSPPHNGYASITDTIGTWYNIPIYLDSHIKYTDNTIYLGKKNSTLQIGIIDSSVTDERATITGGYNLLIKDKLKAITVITDESEYNKAKLVLREIALIKMGI